MAGTHRHLQPVPRPRPEPRTGRQGQQEAHRRRPGSIYGLLELRRLHVALDNAVRDAYGWTDLNLGHDFVEVETLPENDRVRYTISPAARKEVLKRLLALNHQRAKAEALMLPAAKPPAKRRKAQTDDSPGLFPLD